MTAQVIYPRMTTLIKVVELMVAAHRVSAKAYQVSKIHLRKPNSRDLNPPRSVIQSTVSKLKNTKKMFLKGWHLNPSWSLEMVFEADKLISVLVKS